MKFNLNTEIAVKKTFTVEADTLKEAMDMVEEQVPTLDLNALEFVHISFDMTDPTILEYNSQWALKRIQEYKEKYGWKG